MDGRGKTVAEGLSSNAVPKHQGLVVWLQVGCVHQVRRGYTRRCELPGGQPQRRTPDHCFEDEAHHLRCP